MVSVTSLAAPATLPEALELLAGGGMPLAGGTDIVPLCRDGKIKDAALVDLSRLAGRMGAIELENGVLSIGAMTRLDVCQHSGAVLAACPALAAACGMVGSRQIRNRATVAGNIAHASPAADTVPVLVAAGAKLVLESTSGRREALLEDVLLGPGKTAIAPGELITAILVPVPQGGWQGGYEKLGGRTAMTISIAAVAVLYHKDTGYRAAYGAVSPAVRRAAAVENALNSGDEAALPQAVAACVSPIGDIRASAAYRARVCENLTRRLYRQIRKEV